jgi:hypothetical protein
MEDSFVATTGTLLDTVTANEPKKEDFRIFNLCVTHSDFSTVRIIFSSFWLHYNQVSKNRMINNRTITNTFSVLPAVVKDRLLRNGPSACCSLWGDGQTRLLRRALPTTMKTPVEDRSITPVEDFSDPQIEDLDRERLAGLLRLGVFGNRSSCARDVALLKSSPALAGEDFVIPHDRRDRYPPLCHLYLMIDADSELLEILYNLFPDVLKKPNGRLAYMLPLHFVCHPKHAPYLSRSPYDDWNWRREVIAFLIEKYPEARSKETKDRFLPVHLHLSNCHEHGSEEEQYQKIETIADMLWCDALDAEEGKCHIDRALRSAMQQNNSLVLRYLT